MKSRTLLIGVMTLVAVLGISVRLLGQEEQGKRKEHDSSTIIDLETLGRSFFQVANACIPKSAGMSSEYPLLSWAQVHPRGKLRVL